MIRLALLPSAALLVTLRAEAQFTHGNAYREVWCTSNIQNSQDFDSQGGVINGPQRGDWSHWAVANSYLGSGSFNANTTYQYGAFAPASVSVRIRSTQDFVMAPGDSGGVYIDDSVHAYFTVVEPTSTLVYSRVAVQIQALGEGFPSGSLYSAVHFSGRSGSLIGDLEKTFAIGPKQEVIRQFAVTLEPGEYEVNMGVYASHAQRANSDAQLEVIAGCSQEEFAYAFPVEGIVIDATINFAGEKSTQPLAMTGSVKGTLVRMCDETPVGMRLTSMELVTIQPSVTWTVTPDISVTISNMHAVVNGSVGEPGGLASINDGCCGTLMGVAPYVTGDATVSVMGKETTLPLAFLFPGLYEGIPFDVSSVLAGSGTDTIALDVSFSLAADFGLGDSNPIVSWAGTMTGTGGSCVAADFNCDGVVNGADLGELLGAWSSGPDVSGCGGLRFPCPSDLNLDGVVDGADLGALLGEWTI